MDLEQSMSQRRFFDVGAYLTTPTFKGIYDGIKEHEPDLTNVVNRAWKRGVDNIIIPGINFNVSREAIEIAKTDERIFATVGCSPARSHEFDREGPENYSRNLGRLVEDNRSKVLALGELGLDYRWLEICDRDTQMKYFMSQLELAKDLKIPIFVNTRNSVPDIIAVLKKYDGQLFGGIIHSFDGTAEEARQFLDLGYYISINGCSLRTEENLRMVKSIPLENIVMESNSPWCLLKPLHAGYRFIKTTYPARAKFHWSPDSMVRGRNEPANINQILEVISMIKEESMDKVAEQVYKNSRNVFFDKVPPPPSPLVYPDTFTSRESSGPDPFKRPLGDVQTLEEPVEP